jgi:hypothetical protein
MIAAYQSMGWAAALMFGAAFGGGLLCAYLWWLDYHSSERSEIRRVRRRNRKLARNRIRISAAELDAASITGQFYVPYGQRDKKGIDKP